MNSPPATWKSLLVNCWTRLRRVGLRRLTHDVERVDEGVQRLHVEAVGDQRFRAICKSGDRELHSVVVQT